MRTRPIQKMAGFFTWKLGIEIYSIQLYTNVNKSTGWFLMKNYYSTKMELIKAYAKFLIDSNAGFDGYSHAYIYAKLSAKYNPMIYRGGWVIDGFGVSTERISIISK